MGKTRVYPNVTDQPKAGKRKASYNWSEEQYHEVERDKYKCKAVDTSHNA
jgi:hypothetical protein